MGHSFVQSLLEFRATFACDCRSDDHFLAVLFEFLDGIFDAEVALVEGDNEIFFGKLRVECFEFILEHFELLVSVFGKTVNHKEQRVCTFDVLEELVAKARLVTPPFGLVTRRI